MLKGRNAIVTGSTSGIGLAIARSLASAGCNILLNGFAAQAAVRALQDELRGNHGVQAGYSPADMSRPKEIAGMIRQGAREFGAVDILVNNAGIQFTAPVERFPAAQWDGIIAVNLSAAFHAIRLALPGMQRRNFGRIVNTASVHGLVASAHKAAYVAAKHGLVGFTKVVALENAAANITCNAICPGWVRTPLVEKQIAAKARREHVSAATAAANLLGQKQPSQRFVQAEHIGALVVFLCGDNGAAMTGEILTMDGGWTAQ
jgi:3-hydroxybutyrate dehydrogenase